MHRTGILMRFGARHAYGTKCYSETGCAAIILRLARRIDARAFNPEFPRLFPRFVQHAIWRFCAQSGFDQCNGNKINDRGRCKLSDCALFRQCGRQALAPVKAAATTD
jgi:hypothetical protein